VGLSLLYNDIGIWLKVDIKPLQEFLDSAEYKRGMMAWVDRASLFILGCSGYGTCRCKITSGRGVDKIGRGGSFRAKDRPPTPLWEGSQIGAVGKVALSQRNML